MKGTGGKVEVLKVIIKIEIVDGKSKRKEIRHSAGIMEMKKLAFFFSLKLFRNIHECRANSELLTNVIKQEGDEQLVYLINTK